MLPPIKRNLIVPRPSRKESGVALICLASGAERIFEKICLAREVAHITLQGQGFFALALPLRIRRKGKADGRADLLRLNNVKISNQIHLAYPVGDTAGFEPAKKRELCARWGVEPHRSFVP